MVYLALSGNFFATLNPWMTHNFFNYRYWEGINTIFLQNTDIQEEWGIIFFEIPIYRRNKVSHISNNGCSENIPISYFFNYRSWAGMSYHIFFQAQTLRRNEKTYFFTNQYPDEDTGFIFVQLPIFRKNVVFFFQPGIPKTPKLDILPNATRYKFVAIERSTSRENVEKIENAKKYANLPLFGEKIYNLFFRTS